MKDENRPEDLKPRTRGYALRIIKVFTPAAALNYLNGLPAPTKELALQYIRTAPEQTMTAFRRLLNAANQED